MMVAEETNTPLLDVQYKFTWHLFLACLREIKNKREAEARAMKQQSKRAQGNDTYR